MASIVSNDLFRSRRCSACIGFSKYKEVHRNARVRSSHTHRDQCFEFRSAQKFPKCGLQPHLARGPYVGPSWFVSPFSQGFVGTKVRRPVLPIASDGDKIVGEETL